MKQIIKLKSSYLSKQGSIELYNKWAIIAPHNNFKIH